LRGLPRLQQRRQKRLIALDQARFARRGRQRSEPFQQARALERLLLQPLHQLQATHQPKALGLDLRRSRSFAMLGVESADPRLVELCCFAQKPLRRERLAVGWLHVCCPQDTVPLEVDTPSGRRVLVAIVDGNQGAQIQRWRERYDPRQALRLPPHLTVCYRPPLVEVSAIEAQVRHAFRQPITVRLGGPFVLPHVEAPLAIEVLDETAALDEARVRLFDGTFTQMGGRDEWPWHITCVRYGHSRDREALMLAARTELALNTPWTIERISYLELRGGRYESLTEWSLGQSARAAPGAR
jgi:hypothetical protein